ncbi:MAG: OmpA family protein [Candidatus Krumholzibacteriia bacterium]
MKRILGILAVAVIVTAALPVFAGVGFHGTRGLIRTRSADTIGKGMLSFQLSTHYFQNNEQQDSLGIGSFPGIGTITIPTTVDYHFFISRASLTYGLSDFLEVSGNLDVRNWIRNPEDRVGQNLDVVTRGGIGDTQVNAKLGVPLPTPAFKLGMAGEVSFPTGSDERRFSTEETEFLLMGLATLDFTDLDAFVPTRFHLNAGYQWNRNETRGYGIFDPTEPDSSGFGPPSYPAVPPGQDDTYNDLFLFNAAIEFPAPQVTFFLEFDWQNFINIDSLPSGVSDNILTLTPGISIPMANGFEITGAGDINLNSGDTPSLAGPPDWGLWLMLSKQGAVVPQDLDKDGIPDDEDQCPDQPEDLDGFQDDDGCPDLDNDGDGVPDFDDKCPDLPEDFEGFEDQDGCPDLDNDQDGIPDVDDRCPNEPEDFDGDQDEDGCPDLVKDSDNDGVPDDLDRCPLQAEDVDGFQDEDGCPDLDNDLDGIPDTDDKCPNAPEAFNGFEDEDGCPDERPIEQQFILQGVTFESGSAALTPDSYRVLDEVVRSLMAYPEVRVEIQGYTDSVGKAGYNLGLSDRRAGAVKQYLVNAGIDPSRLVARGYGEENPIASNSTPGGRAQNRRIEFKRLN